MNRRERRALSRDEQRRASAAAAEAVGQQDTATWWNGEPAVARRVSLVVADDGAHPLAWYRPYVGQRREAVQVTYGGTMFYLDNADGSGWYKVTEGRGSPRWAHSSLYPVPGSVEPSL